MEEKSWVNTLSQVDSFGIGYNFQINTKDKFKTTLGAMLTIIYYLVILILFLELGEEVYKRKKPKVSLNTDIAPYQEVRLSNQNFTYAYRVEDNDGIQIIDDSKFKQQVKYFHYRIINGTWESVVQKILPRKRCPEIENYKDKELYFNISLENWNCIDFDNITLGGNWDGNFVHGIEIGTLQCENATDLNGGSQLTKFCASQEEIRQMFSPEAQNKRIFYSTLSAEVYPSMDDYDAPLKTHLINNYELLNIGLTKRNIKTYKSTQMVNDVGWFFPEYLNQDSIVSTDTVFHDFTFKSEKAIHLFDQFLYLGRKVDTYNRSYYKIQEAVAAVGGFSRILFILLNLMYFYAGQTYRNLYLLSNLFYESEDEINNDFKTKNFENKIRNVTNNCNSNSNNICYNSEFNRINLFDHNLEIKKKKFIVNSNNIEIKRKIESEIKMNLNNLENIKRENKTVIKKFSSLTNQMNFPSRKYVRIFYMDYFIAKYFCIKNRNFNVNKHLEMIKEYKKYFSQCLDILTYFKIQNEFKNIKEMLLDEQQREMIESQNHKLNYSIIKSKFSEYKENKEV